MKVITFDARHTKAKLSASMGGDHIILTPKLRPEEDRNGTVRQHIFDLLIMEINQLNLVMRNTISGTPSCLC